MRFRDGDTIVSPKCTGPLFYVEFDAQSLRLGVGVKEFSPQTLSVYRTIVGSDMRGIVYALNLAVKQAKEQGDEIIGPLLSRLPRGYEGSSHPELLKRKGFFVHRETPLPEAIHSPGFVDYCAEWFKSRAAVFDALRKVALTSLTNGS